MINRKTCQKNSSAFGGNLLECNIRLQRIDILKSEMLSLFFFQIDDAKVWNKKVDFVCIIVDDFDANLMTISICKCIDSLSMYTFICETFPFTCLVNAFFKDFEL